MDDQTSNGIWDVYEGLSEGEEVSRRGGWVDRVLTRDNTTVSLGRTNGLGSRSGWWTESGERGPEVGRHKERIRML